MRYGIRAVPTSFKVFKRPMYLVFLVGTMARIPCRYLLYIRYWHDFRCTTKWAAVSCYLCDDDKGGRNAAWFRWENLFPQPIDLATLFSQTEVLRISGPIAIARIFWEPQAQWSRLHRRFPCGAVSKMPPALLPTRPETPSIGCSENPNHKRKP